MLNVGAQAVVFTSAWRPGRDDVPACTALGDVVQRGELACQRVRVAVGGGGSADQANAFRSGGKRSQQCQRLQRAGGELTAFRADQTVGQKHRIKLGGFGNPGSVNVQLQVSQ